MTDDEIIEVVQAKKAGMRIEFYSNCGYGWCPATAPSWNFGEFHFRIHPADLPKWNRIKGERLAEANLHCKVEHPKVMPAPDLPPLPEDGLVVLPVGFVKLESWAVFYGWCWTDIFAIWDRGEYEGVSGDPRTRYAVPATSEIARLNGVGLGECPSKWGWHNPDGLTPDQVSVPKYRLLCREEVGVRRRLRKEIHLYSPDGGGLWDASGWEGGMLDRTFRTAAPYGSLPPVIEHTFPECAPTKPDLGYGFNLDGYAITAPDHNHEIIPVNTKVHPGEVTHAYYDGAWRWWEITLETTLRGTGHIRAYARKKYSVLHAESGIKPGDVVEVTRAAEPLERGWEADWNPDMNEYVGRRGNVIADEGEIGFLIQFGEDQWWFPAFVLRKVERVRVPLEASDWGGGPWCVRRTGDITIADMVVGVTCTTGAIQTVLFGIRGAKELEKEFERARGWPGDDLAFEPCFKWADESEG